jgi:hypothetical protein
MMAWEHALLGDLDPALAWSAADGDFLAVEDYRALLSRLGRSPRRVGQARLRATHPGLDTVRLPGSGLVVTVGELNVLPDYLGRPEDIASAPLRFLGPLIQSVRSWSIAELGRSAGHRNPFPRLLPGSLRYPLLGPAAETAEIAVITALGRRLGFPPANWYASVLARNACHFAPFSWYRWHEFHRRARALIERSASAGPAERAALRLRARVCAGYADHFLQDSFAAGHLINKTLVLQWYIEWLADRGVSYPHRDVLDALTVARQPLLHGPGHYDRAAARRLDGTAGRAGAVPEPPWDPQDVADAPTLEERVAASGVAGDGDAGRRAAYTAYLAMLGSGTVQLAVKVAHEYLNKRSLVVSAGPAGPRFRMYGDHTMLASPEGAARAARAAAASRRAITELLRDGSTSVDSWEIFDSFPDHVEQDGRLVPLPEWHRGGLRDLCLELFAQRATRAVRIVMSGAFRQLGRPVDDPRPAPAAGPARLGRDEEQPGGDHAAGEAAEGRGDQPVQAAARPDDQGDAGHGEEQRRDRVGRAALDVAGDAAGRVVAAPAVEDVQAHARHQRERDELGAQRAGRLRRDQDEGGEGRHHEQHQGLGGAGAQADRLREHVALERDRDEQQAGERAGQAGDRHAEVVPRLGLVPHVAELSH